MTITDLIDEELMSLGASQQSVDRARQITMAFYCTTEDKKHQIKKELTEMEIEHYRTIIHLYLLAVLINPEFREQLKQEIKQDLEKN